MLTEAGYVLFDWSVDTLAVVLEAPDRDQALEAAGLRE